MTKVSVSIVGCVSDGVACPDKNRNTQELWFIKAPACLDGGRKAEHVRFRPHLGGWRIERQQVRLSWAFKQLAKYECEADQYRAIARLRADEKLLHKSDMAYKTYAKFNHLPEEGGADAIVAVGPGDRLKIEFRIPSGRRDDTGRAVSCVQRFVVRPAAWGEGNFQHYELKREISHECAFTDLAVLASEIEEGKSIEQAVLDYIKQLAARETCDLANDHPGIKTIGVIRVWVLGALQGLRRSVGVLDRLTASPLGRFVMRFTNSPLVKLSEKIRGDRDKLEAILRLCDEGKANQIEEIIGTFQNDLKEFLEGVDTYEFQEQMALIDKEFDEGRVIKV